MCVLLCLLSGWDVVREWLRWTYWNCELGKNVAGNVKKSRMRR